MNSITQISSFSQFHIRLICEENRHEVISLLLNSFFQDEPLALCLQLDEPIDFARNLFNNALHDQCSFVVYDNQTERLVGICLNEIKFKNDKEIINEPNEKISFILHLLNSLHKNRNLYQEFQINSLLHIIIINIETNYRGHGLGSQLISATIEYAKKMNIKGIYAETTNSYSLNCFKQHHFEIYDQIIYIDYDFNRLANLTDSHQNQCQLVARRV
ncbi:hypothetical protein I4U23_005963 [Adineta vaga]|nr:hypothetical protein I4U23_005963 [Adineta vaga]